MNEREFSQIVRDRHIYLSGISSKSKLPCAFYSCEIIINIIARFDFVCSEPERIEIALLRCDDDSRMNSNEIISIKIVIVYIYVICIMYMYTINRPQFRIGKRQSRNFAHSNSCLSPMSPQPKTELLSST